MVSPNEVSERLDVAEAKVRALTYPPVDYRNDPYPKDS